MDSIGFIGDIHGHPEQLADLLGKIPSHVNKLVFLGDYVDRGPDSSGVLDILCDLQDQGRGTVFLSGNHDRALRAALDTGFIQPFCRLAGRQQSAATSSTPAVTLELNLLTQCQIGIADF